MWEALVDKTRCEGMTVKLKRDWTDVEGAIVEDGEMDEKEEERRWNCLDGRFDLVWWS